MRTFRVLFGLAVVIVSAQGCGSDEQPEGAKSSTTATGGTGATTTQSGGAGGSAPGGAGGFAPGGAGGAATGGAPTANAVGDPCTAETACPAGGSGEPVCLTDWPGGYCAVSGCAEHGHDCPNDPGLMGTATTGGKCVLAPDPTCLALCASSSDCRDGYTCAPKPDAAGHGDVNVCVPTSG